MDRMGGMNRMVLVMFAFILFILPILFILSKNEFRD